MTKRHARAAATSLRARTHVLDSTAQLTEVLRRTTREMSRALDADIGTVWRVTDKGNELVPIAGYHVPKALHAMTPSLPLLRRHPLIEHLERSERPIWSSHSQGDPRFGYPLLRVLPHKSVLVHPIRATGPLLGAFALLWVRAPHQFTMAELRLVKAIGQQAAIAMDNVRRLGQLGLVTAELERRVEDQTSELQAATEALHRSREELRARASDLERVREMERGRIARDIHDELGQELVALKMDVARLRHEVPDTTGIVPRKAKAMAATIDGIVRAVRRIASELRPRILDDLGLAAALEWQARNFERRVQIRCRFTCTRQPEPLPAELATAVFRICQEMLTNVARHANASAVDVSLVRDRTGLVLEVRDNGKGIADTATGDPRASGLVGMRERAAAFDGRVTTRSVPGHGTTVTLRVPLPWDSRFPRR
jgi:signal transduction histidine kinase